MSYNTCNVTDETLLPLYWEMENAEKIALLNVLKDIQPSISIEVGTKKGGSLQLIAKYSKTVYSIDIDPTVKELQPGFPNVNFIIGDSKQILPQILNDLASRNEQPDFILIDGDHSAAGVAADINSVLRAKITKPLVVIMHDSFNPECKKGMLAPDYKSFPAVEFVDIEFVRGTFSPNENTKDEMWGGFGLIRFSPEPQRRKAFISDADSYCYNRVYSLSKHYRMTPPTFGERLKAFIFKRLFG